MLNFTKRSDLSPDIDYDFRTNIFLFSKLPRLFLLNTTNDTAVLATSENPKRVTLLHKTHINKINAMGQIEINTDMSVQATFTSKRSCRQLIVNNVPTSVPSEVKLLSILLDKSSTRGPLQRKMISGQYQITSRPAMSLT